MNTKNIKFEFKTINDIFNFYRKTKEKNQYFININGKSLHINCHFLDLQKNAIIKNKTHIYDGQNNLGKVVIRKKIVDRYHPNKINNKDFWVKAKKEFPLASVCGNFCEDIYSCNNMTLGLAKKAGVLGFVDYYIKQNNNVNIFEIGYGHGNVFFYLKEKYDNVKEINYKGIDFYKTNKLKKHKELCVIEKSGIPDYILNNSIDIVYSFNVLQHCSSQDRDEYFKQSFDKLKPMGYFVGGMFLETDDNKNKSCWGIEDISGRKYCGFLNQFTEVDTIYEFKTKMNKIGYLTVEIKPFGDNYFSFLLLKPNI
ncbi:MAG: methyltransferase domain-containing protein [Candidatus Izemoplasmatales bacterium]